MERASNRFSGLAATLIAATLVLTLASSRQAGAQGTEQEATSSDAATAAADRPQTRRERRRAAEAAAEAEKAEVAQTQAAAEPGVTALAETVVEAEEEELVCKMYKQTGTKIGKRVCGTQAEWDAFADQTAAEAKDVVREIGARSQFPAAPEVPAAFPTP